MQAIHRAAKTEATRWGYKIYDIHLLGKFSLNSNSTIALHS